MPPQLSYYQLLNISSSASSKQIKNAFRRQILKHHPDKNIKQSICLQSITDKQPNQQNSQQNNMNNLNNDNKLKQIESKQKLKESEERQNKQISMLIIQAYQCLSNEQQRKKYDYQLNKQQIKQKIKHTRFMHKVDILDSNSNNNNNTQQQYQQNNVSTTKQQEEQLIIFPCEQCQGQNELNIKQLQKQHPDDVMSINCQHCGIYMVIQNECQ